ncbi:phosphogluconate dehydrogenase (NAD(+)-dependent, decarboxylating) [Pelobacter propionicus]|uniref:6-phosphogluconate dehydrogenase (Decarboxylating) n=1 Tax=Pelobacter propionicus (strain DSM 2379 / NBRC 103807 / OttBd1) TaxID=338966 RepID=A1AR86_PELPD|nr:decarboxylating 6-phosphogluconate dehydrogenase [Pelobacter propionicus]ABK99856.1 6-phosphogluconate dehydrogenase (decarboxylating) [Pelobacter propionicus DSM 2379]
MRMGMIGVGRMGGDMVRRLLKGGHECVVHARRPSSMEPLVREGALGAAPLAELVSLLPKPRVVWLMIPAASVDRVIADIAPLLDAGDILIDGGNSHYHDDIRRCDELRDRSIHYLDVGTSGGVWGLERGYCLMIGGEREAVQYLDPLFATLAPGRGAAPDSPGRSDSGSSAERGYLHCGPSGAGHFVKMVHNGIEYGMMAAYAEGFNILAHANIGSQERETDAETTPLRDPRHFRFELNLADIAELWRRGSVVSSWLLDLTARALAAGQGLERFSGQVSDSGEGRWTVATAIEAGVPAPVLATALFQRFSSRGEADFADRLLSAMRYEFGGHHEKSTSGEG